MTGVIQNVCSGKVNNSTSSGARQAPFLMKKHSPASLSARESFQPKQKDCERGREFAAVQIFPCCWQSKGKLWSFSIYIQI